MEVIRRFNKDKRTDTAVVFLYDVYALSGLVVGLPDVWSPPDSQGGSAAETLHMSEVVCKCILRRWATKPVGLRRTHYCCRGPQ